VLKLPRRTMGVLKAYFLSEFIRSRGFIYGLISMGLWIVLFSMPIALFTPPDVDKSVMASRMFVGLMLFVYFSAATWDWAAELRWMIIEGRIEYFITSNAGFLPHYLAIFPVTITWLLIALGLMYLLLSIVWAPPAIVVYDLFSLVVGVVLYTISLMGYALILGSSMISTGTTGFIVEILGFVLPIATGGILPLRYSPELLRTIALYTPFSYPAELIRYSLLGIEPVVPVEKAVVTGLIYGLLFVAVGVVVFKIQLKKALKMAFPLPRYGRSVKAVFLTHRADGSSSPIPFLAFYFLNLLAR